MSMILDRLANLLEILAAKRTPEEIEKDRLLQQKHMDKKKEKDDKRRAKTGQKPQQYRKEGGKAAKEKPSAKAARIEGLGKPLCIFLLNTKASKTENGYSSFMKSEKDDVSQSIKNSISFTTSDGVYSWLCSKADSVMLVDQAEFLGIPQQVIELSDEILAEKEPFKGVKIKLDEVGDVGKLKLDLNEAWKPLASAFAEKQKPKEDEKTKEEKAPEEKKDEVELDTTKKEEEPESKTEDNVEKDEDTDFEMGDAPKVNVGKFRSLKNPYFFMLDPRKRYAEYQNFIGPDNKDDEVKKASQVLPKAIKFLVSRKLKSQEGAPVVVYFLDGKQAQDIKMELKKESRPHYKLVEFDKTLFDTDEPFSNLKLGEEDIEKLLADELNKVWMEAASQSSGNPVPAVQANTLVPLDFFRLMSKKHRPIEMYIGNQPEGAGSEDTIYILAPETEAEAFMTLVRKFKMPSNFYERMSANSDIDTEFKDIDPEEFEPANVLILTADGQFQPKKVVEPTEDNRDLIEAVNAESKEILDKIAELTKKKEELTKKGKAKPEEIKKLDDEIKKLQEETKVTQLAILHAFARIRLGNRTKKAGTFVKSKVVIGTHIANFNADMSICFLWGSITKHVTLDPKEVVKQLPFVKTVVTSYL